MKIKDLRALNERKRVKLKYPGSIDLSNVDKYIEQELTTGKNKNLYTTNGVSLKQGSQEVQEIIDRFNRENRKAANEEEAMLAAKIYLKKLRDNRNKTVGQSKAEYANDKDLGDKLANQENINKSIKGYMYDFNKSKNVEQKDELVALALQTFGIKRSVVDKIKNLQTGLLSNFVRAFKWDQFEDDNTFIQFLKNFPREAIVNNVVLKSKKYFQLAYNDYVNGSLNIDDQNIYKNSYWNNRSRNVASNSSSKSQLGTDIKKAKKSMSKDEFIDIIANNVSKEDSLKILSKAQQNENNNR